MGLVLSVFQTLVDMRILIFFLFCRNLCNQHGVPCLARRLPWNALVKYIESFILLETIVLTDADWYRWHLRTNMTSLVQALLLYGGRSSPSAAQCTTLVCWQPEYVQSGKRMLCVGNGHDSAIWVSANPCGHFAHSIYQTQCTLSCLQLIL